MLHLLIIGADPALRAELSHSLEKSGCQVTARGPTNGMAAPHFSTFDAILADPTAIDREPLLEAPADHRSGPPVIVFAGADDVRQAVRAMQRGAADYLPLPIKTEELLAGLNIALLPGAPGWRLDRELLSFALVGDEALAEVRKGLHDPAASDATVLIEGESGKAATAKMAEQGNGESEPFSLDAYFIAFVLQNQEQMTETELAAKLGISRKNLWERRRRMNIPRTKTQKRGPRRSAPDGRDEAGQR